MATHAQFAQFKSLIGWRSLTGSNRRHVGHDIDAMGVERAVMAWRNEGLSPVPSGIRRLIEASGSLTSVGPLGVEGVGY